MKDQTLQARKYDILGIDFDFIDFTLALAKVRELITKKRRGYITLTNPRGVVIARKDPSLRDALTNAELVLPDGIGIILASILLGYGRSCRVDGPTLMLKICDKGRKYGYAHYFYGGKEGVARKLVEKLTEEYPGLDVVGTHCPPFRKLSQQEDDAVIEEINAAKPDIVWVGTGAPKQDKWMHDHLGRIHAPVMVGVGAAFDYNSGNMKRAPKWVRACCLEWLYRLFIEPRRHFPRKIQIFHFLYLVIVRAITFRCRL